MSVIFIVIYSIWLLSEVLVNRLMHSNKRDKQQADKGSLLFIWLTITISITAAVYIANSYFLPVSSYSGIKYFGLALIILGIIMRLLVIRSLGKLFTVDVTIRENHRLKKDGFYRYLRHPSYFASFISFIGFGLSLNNWISLLLVTVLIFIAFAKRIKIEEKALTAFFGKEYQNYKKQTKAIIPFIY